MKLHEFRECIDKLDDYYQKEEFVEIQGKKFPIAKGDPYICVPVVTEETYIGPRPSTSVCLVEEGFDWEQGCIYSKYLYLLIESLFLNFHFCQHLLQFLLLM